MLQTESWPGACRLHYAEMLDTSLHLSECTWCLFFILYSVLFHFGATITNEKPHVLQKPTSGGLVLSLAKGTTG